jgi:hypothetical protein
VEPGVLEEVRAGKEEACERAMDVIAARISVTLLYPGPGKVLAGVFNTPISDGTARTACTG